MPGRTLETIQGWIVGVIAVAIGLAALYLARFGIQNDSLVRVGSVTVAIVLLAVAAMRFGTENRILSPGNVLLAAMAGIAIVAGLHFGTIAEELETGLYDLTTLDVGLAVAGLAVLLEMTRRHAGLPLAAVALCAILYSVFGEYLPWFFRHTGFALDQTMAVLWYGFDGVFGQAVAVVTSLIIVYIVFGSVLEGVGAGEVLLKFAFRITRRMRGGPAHAAIVASALFGTLSGSVAANVVGTGAFTIPMIRKRGFSPRFAGAIEAAASTGGQITPPVMGAVAFIMAEMLGIPYLTICIAALVPALFYYFSLFAAVSVEAERAGIEITDEISQDPITRRDWLLSIAFIVPLLIIVGALVAGRSAAFAGFYATAAAFALGVLLNAEIRTRPMAWLAILANAGRASATIMIPVAAVGIIIGIMNQTGLGLRFASAILEQSDGSLLIGLLIMMAGCLVLGMGMPTVPAYLTIVIIIGPAISQMDVPILIVHLFAVYYGVLSAITPPVALAAYVAAPIAGASPMATGFTACRVALVGFVVPFVFVYNPELILVEGFEPASLAWTCVCLAVSIWMLVTGVAGHDGGQVPLIPRLMRLACAPLLMFATPVMQAPALILALALFALPRMRSIRRPILDRKETQ